MEGKLLGAMLIIGSCGGMGFLLAAASRKEERLLSSLISALELMECELKYRLTPLPELFSLAGREQSGVIREIFLGLSEALSRQNLTEAEACMETILENREELPKSIREAFHMLGMSLGRFDAEGQSLGMEETRCLCRRKLETMRTGRDSRLRSYETLGLCAGAALAILFV